MTDDARPSAISPVVDIRNLWSKPNADRLPRAEEAEEVEYLVTVAHANGEAEQLGPFPDSADARRAVITYPGYESGSKWHGHTTVMQDGTRFTIERVSGLPGFEERRALRLTEEEQRQAAYDAARAEREAAQETTKDEDLFGIRTRRAVSPSHGAIGERHSRTIPQDVKIQVSVRDQGRCVQCGTTADLHYDHKIPWSRGGTNTVNNIGCGSFGVSVRR
jgi:hypothetical protein